MKYENKKVLNDSKSEFIVNIINSILLRGTVLIIPVIWSYALDNIYDGLYNKAINLIILSLVITIIYYGLEQLYQITFYKLYNKLYNLYENLYTDNFYKNSLFSLSRFSLGEYNNLLNSDIDVIASYYANYPMRIIRIIEFVVIYFCFYTINPIIFIITLVVSIISLGYMVYGSKETERLNKIRKDTLDYKTASNHEIYNNIRDIKSFNIYDKISFNTNKKRRSYLDANAKFNIQSTGVKFIAIIMVEIVRLLLMIYGIYLIKNGNIEVGSLLIIYNYYQKIVDNYTIVSNALINKKSLKVSLNRFSKILENASKEKMVNEDIKISGNIVFKNILYGYRDNPTLKNINLVLYDNSINVITGPSGSGKSGIVDLLLKMNRPHKGTICIGDKNIFDIKSNNYYNLIACVSKSPTFFNDSIKNNLLLVNDNFDYVVSVCKTLNIHNYIMSLKDGYNTNINSNIKRSVVYLLAIARVMIKNSKIMIFDESLAMIDKKDIEIIKKILLDLKKDHTIIVIDREQNIDDISDHIVVIDDHIVVEEGSREELLRKNSFYSKFTLKK